MERNSNGYYPLQLGGEHFLLDIERREQIVCAWLYPVEDGADSPEVVPSRDPYALDLTALGEDGDDDWYDYPDNEIASIIADALDMTEVEVGLEDDRTTALEGVAVDVTSGLHEWALAGYRLARDLNAALFGPEHPPSVSEAIDACCRAADALKAYRKTRHTITAVDSRVRHAASVTTTDNERIAAMVTAAYRLAGYKVTARKDEESADQQLSIETQGEVG